MLIWIPTLHTTLVEISTRLYGSLTLLFRINIFLLSSISETRLFPHMMPKRPLRISSPTVQFRPRLYVFPISIASLSRYTYRSLLPNYHGKFLTFLIEHLGLPCGSLHNRGSWLSSWTPFFPRATRSPSGDEELRVKDMGSIWESAQKTFPLYLHSIWKTALFPHFPHRVLGVLPRPTSTFTQTLTF